MQNEQNKGCGCQNGGGCKGNKSKVLSIELRMRAIDAEMEGMKSDNALRARSDSSPAYGYNEFMRLTDEYVALAKQLNEHLEQTHETTQEGQDQRSATRQGGDAAYQAH